MLAVVPPSGVREKLHSRTVPVVVHINSNSSPSFTNAAPGGEIVTAPRKVARLV